MRFSRLYSFEAEVDSVEEETSSDFDGESEGEEHAEIKTLYTSKKLKKIADFFIVPPSVLPATNRVFPSGHENHGLYRSEIVDVWLVNMNSTSLPGIDYRNIPFVCQEI